VLYNYKVNIISQTFVVMQLPFDHHFVVLLLTFVILQLLAFAFILELIAVAVEFPFLH
jgi:hypothetical protein